METPVISRPLARWSTSASQLIVIIIMPVVFIRTRLYCCRYDCIATALLYSIKIRVHRTLLFVFLQHNALSVRCPHPSVHHSVAVARERTCYPEDLPTRQSAIQSQSLKSARVTLPRRPRASARVRQSLDGATVTLRLLSARRRSCKPARATGTGCRSRPWVDIIWGCQKL